MSTVNFGGGSSGSYNSGSTNNVQVLNLSTASQIQFRKHQAVLLELEAKKIAATITDGVPTLPIDVRRALRNLQLPVRLFGENLANVRDRLKYELAKRQVLLNSSSSGMTGLRAAGLDQYDQHQQEVEEEVTKYTHASHELIVARQAMSKFSLQRAQLRLQNERSFRMAHQQQTMKRKRNLPGVDLGHMTNDATPTTTKSLEALERLNNSCIQTYKSLRQMSLEGSQYGDSRVVSCICTSSPLELPNTPIIATGSWTGNVQLWDGNSAALTKIGEQFACHEDRIMGIAMMSRLNNTGGVDNATSSESTTTMICTTSIDRTAKLWKVQRNTDSGMSEEEEEGDETVVKAPLSWSITEQAHLKGHTKRLCRTAFHPMKQHVATTSFDYSWRLWDIETNQASTTMQLLLQDGHWKETYGIGFHCDGSLCATTDFAGVIQCWDLRTGKSIRHFLGHAKRLLNVEFHPTNGFQLASAGDDGTIKIWDLRQRKQLSSIPAHSNIVTQLRFDPNQGEYLVSSSFDGTIKLWSTRTWKLLNTMKGHEGKVSGVDIISSWNGNHSRQSIISCGFDKTLKLWR